MTVAAHRDPPPPRGVNCATPEGYGFSRILKSRGVRDRGSTGGGDTTRRPRLR